MATPGQEEVCAVTTLCSDCVHSSPNTSDRDAGTFMLDCDCKKFMRGYYLRNEELPHDGMHVEDDEGWAFTVGPNFGCVHAVRRIAL